MKRSLLAAALLLAIGSASAATFNVTRFDDPAEDGCSANGCSLREAVTAANAAAGLDTVVLPAGQYTLATQIAIRDDTRIEGAGMTSTQIVNAPRYFWISDSSVTLLDLSLVGGGSTGVPGVQGGAIYADNAELRLERVRIADVVLGGFAYGAGIYAEDSSVELRASVLENNRSTTYGGGLALQRSTLSLTRGTKFISNSARQAGGAIWLKGTGTSTNYITADADVAFTNNWTDYDGGAIWADAVSLRSTAGGGNGERLLLMDANFASRKGGAVCSSGRTTLEGVRIQGGGSGDGAIHAQAVTLTRVHLSRHKTEGQAPVLITGTAGKSFIERSAFEGNHSSHDDGAGALANLAGILMLTNVDFYNGGSDAKRIIDNAGDLTLRHVTIARDPTTSRLTALYQRSSGASVVVNSAMAGQCGGSLSRISSLGGNQRESVSGFVLPCPFNQATDRPSISLSQFGLSYGEHGGDFRVSAIANGASPLIDRGVATHCALLDVRGATRDTRCDIGAFEYGAVAP